MKKVILSVAILSLIGCGSDDDSPSTPSGGVSGSVNAEGVWDGTEDGDEIYLVVKSGVWIEYDYLGDSYDNGPNCYTSYILDIENRGDNTYRVFYPNLTDSEYSDVKITQSNNNLNFEVIAREISDANASDFAPVGYAFSYKPSTLSESDFSPLCGEDVSAFSVGVKFPSQYISF